ncbi:hypothetical protein EDD21DRAFT_393480 [Dissophora ornata]|nr:hypothetical protein EDD21DRAFT_393480 [Dissophora ornata]
MSSKKTNRMNGTNRDKSLMNQQWSKEDDEPVPSVFIAWAMERIERKEEISMASFSNAFGLTKENDAHAAFMSLLSSTVLPAKQRIAISKAYEVWRGNAGVVFWTWRSAGQRVDVSTGRTVEDLVDRGQLFTRKILQSYPVENGADVQIQGLTSTVLMQSSEVKNTVGSREYEGAVSSPVNVAGHESQREDSQVLKRRSKDDARKTKGCKARRVSKSTEDKSRSIFLQALQQRRTERFKKLDASRFWILKSSGRAVESLLYEASLKEGAPISVRSYTIDVSCETTRAIFLENEWSEILENISFELPPLSTSTNQYLAALRLCLLRGQHPKSIRAPQVPQNSAANLMEPSYDHNQCLALKTAIEWYTLYNKNPSPFGVQDLSEAWWARKAWPAWLDLLDDVDGIFMVDGEKMGIDSSQRKNNDRHYNPDEPSRKKVGRKLDLVCRDEIMSSR